MSPGLRNVRSFGSTSDRNGAASDGQLRQRAVVERVAAALERPAALLHEPQPHHVLQQPIRAVDAPFVRDVERQRLRRVSTACCTSTPISDHVPELM